MWNQNEVNVDVKVASIKWSLRREPMFRTDIDLNPFHLAFIIPDISHLSEEDVIRRGGAICLPVATNSLFMGFVIGIIGNYSSTMKIG